MLTTARCETVLDRIGNTPLVRLSRLTRECDFDVYIKLEYLNPSGSLKDRIALRMIEQAERKGLIEPGKSTIVEATTGNTGIAMSLVAAVKGYKLILFAPNETSEHERLAIMKAYGAEVRLIDVSQTSKEFSFLPKVIQNERSVHGGYVEFIPRKLCKQMEAEQKNVWWARQFSSPDNVGAHEFTTGVEIIEQMRGLNLRLFAASVGTGGTVAGVSKALRKEYSGIKVVALEPAGHPILSGGGEIVVEDVTDGIEHELDMQGTGQPNALLDSVEMIENLQAIRMAKRLCSEEGLFCGVSSGANVFGAIDAGKKMGLGRGDCVVTVAPDSRDRYLTEMRYIT